MAKQNTMQPFEPGDIFLGLTVLNNPDDDHAGDGRIVQYGKDMQLKGELWTEGGEHYVSGLECDNNGVLWAFNDLNVLHVDPQTGQQLPITDKFLPRCYRSASFDAEGNVYLGEHMKADKKPDNEIAKRTTIKFPVIPGDGVLGYGFIYKYDSDWNLLKVFETETAPEMTGFKGGDSLQSASERAVHHLCDGDGQAPDAIRHHRRQADAGSGHVSRRSGFRQDMGHRREAPAGWAVVNHPRRFHGVAGRARRGVANLSTGDVRLV